MTKFLDPLDSAFILLENARDVDEHRRGGRARADDDADPTVAIRAAFETTSPRGSTRFRCLPNAWCERPFDMTWPILINDEKFDLDRHVVRVALPTPGSRTQFDAMVSEFLSRPLSPQRPLWQLLVIEGLEDGRAALVLKAHHALADGVSFAETFANLFDISPEVRPPAPRDEDDDVTTP